ncbi:MAG: protein kinase [Elainellaceae cyanobacterium]
MSQHCSKGHPNPDHGQFCSVCGIPLPAAQEVSPAPESLIGSRYRLQYQLGEGGFGRTYLAEDTHRFSELCVLKEFAPYVEGDEALQKAEVLFEREAGVLYQLQHPQIPTFRELLRANFERRERLFLVQDYVDGKTYQALLDQRQQRGETFTEGEVHQFLLNILPVLEYIHSVNVIHRDISPDNLIMRASDGLPVLIDFGGVKQVVSAVANPASVTLVGKAGFAPAEQIQYGQTYPHSDLYALAATALVLLTGQPAHILLAESPNAWLQHVHVAPRLAVTLSKMLAEDPRDRFQTAKQVRVALSPETDSAARYHHSAATNRQRPSAARSSAPASAPVSVASRAPEAASGWRNAIIVLMAVVMAALGSWAGYRLLPERVFQSEENAESDEQTRRANLQTRRADLGIDSSFLVSITDRAFYARYPEQQGRTLTDAPEDAEWRDRWDAIANEWLTLFEAQLSPQARQGLGSFTPADLDRWTQAVNQLLVGRRALNDLTNAKFFQLFPQQRGEPIFEQPIGQIWYGLALDQLAALQSNETLSRLDFEGNFRQQDSVLLAPGMGHVHVMELSEGDLLRLNLQAPQGKTRLSIYLPSPTDEQPALLEGSRNVTWSGRLPQTGAYEVVVISTAADTISYQLTASVDVVTQPEAPPEDTADDSPEPPDDARPADVESPDSGPSNSGAPGPDSPEAAPPDPAPNPPSAPETSEPSPRDEPSTPP